MKYRRWICVVYIAAFFADVASDGARAVEEQSPAALAEGPHGVVVAVTGPLAVHAGLETLKAGGSAADAALATALAHVVECGGSYVSHAGIFGMVYFDADTGKVHYLNAGFNTPRAETDPLSIPGGGKPSGRTALVPGFMAGVQAAHDRFGKLPRQQVFAPAIELAEQGVKVSPLLGGFLRYRKDVLSRLPETRRIFTKEEGTLYAEGEIFRQPELAKTLRQVADQGAAYMYSGAWADEFVAAVQREGGKLTREDMHAYRALWEEPIETSLRGHRVFAPGLSSLGGVSLTEALHLLEIAELPKQGHFATTPASLFWLMQIGNCQILDYLPAETLKNFAGLDLTPASRVKPETAAAIWQRMQTGEWPFAAKLRRKGDLPPNHSDGVVVADRWGNMAAVTHSIYTVTWGDTGLFVGGISIPDAGAIHQAAIERAGPGNRLADGMCPLIVLGEERTPVLGSSAIGGGLHQKTLQVLSSVLDFGIDPQVAVEQPAFLLPDAAGEQLVAQVDRGSFDDKLLDAVRRLGQPIRELTRQEAGAYRGYWVGVQIAPQSNLRRGIGSRELPSVAEGY